MSQRARRSKGLYWTWTLAVATALAVGCAASGGSQPYGNGSGGGSAGAGASGDGGSAQNDGAIPDGDVDASAGSGGAETGGSGTGGYAGGSGGYSGGSGGYSGGSGGYSGGTDGGGTGGNGGWANCVPLPGGDAGTPPPTNRFMNGAATDAPNKFGGSVDPARAPTIVYPPDGVMMPPNIATMDLQFLPGAGNDLFDVSFESGEVNLHVYTTCSQVSNGCSLKMDGTLFTNDFAEKVAGYEPVMVKVRGVSGSNPGSVGESDIRSLSIAQDYMLGGIYYWDAGGQIVRYDFGHPTVQGESYYNQANGGAMCVGCHSLSTPGNLMAVGLGIPSPATMRVIEVATKNQRFQLQLASNFQAFSPDENEIITSNGASLVWRNAYDGTPANPNPLVAKGTMADYAPDMSKIVFAKPGGFAIASPGINNGSLYLLPRNGLTWGSETLLVQASTSSENNYYPAFSPDGSLVMFNRSAKNNSYLAPDSLVYVVPAAGGTPIALTKANISDQVGNSWPKWAPFMQCNRGHRILWFTVSSARDYGLRIQNPPMPSDPDAGDPRRWQIWMAAVDVDAAESGQDPSYPAFWLPFQNTGTGNHIAQWVKKVVRHPCVTNADCSPGDHCSTDDECVPN